MSDTLPNIWAPDERRVVTVTMNNDGTTTWSPSGPTYALGDKTNNTWHWGYTGVTTSVAPGSSYTFSFVATAPSAASLATTLFSARMRVLGSDYFGETAGPLTITLDPAAQPQWGCSLVADDVPETLTPGEHRVIHLTLKNVGSATWPATGMYVESMDSPATTWVQTRNPLPAGGVAPGASAVATFTITAPATPGTYAFTRELSALAGGIGLFRTRSPYCVTKSITVGGAALLDAAFVNDNPFPARMVAGDVATVNVTMKNTGTEAWQTGGSYMLVSQNSPADLWGAVSGPVVVTTNNGASAVIKFNIKAPSTGPGSYTQKWRMRKVRGTSAGFFGELIDIPVTVTSESGSARYAATVTGQNIPALMTAGTSQQFSVTMQNSGSTAWTGPAFQLYSTSTPAALWGRVASSLGATETIAPGGSRTFNVSVKAPTVAGTYSSSWRLRELPGAGFFGATALTNDIVVTLCGNHTIDPGEQCDDGNLTAGDGCAPTCERECGNGQLDPGEACDGANLDGATCDSVTLGGRPEGTLSCTASCTFDSSACAPAAAHCVDDVAFADPVLEQAVRDALGKPEGPITPTDATQLGYLAVFDPSLSSLGGLECFTNLVTLEVDYSQVSDLQPLAALTQLSTLWLEGNLISDLTPLANLTELTELRVRDNRIESLAGLQGLTHLVLLSFEENVVSELAPLAGLPELAYLYFGSNQVTDLSPLVDVPQLRYLDGTGGNVVSDLMPLMALTRLEEIYLSDSNVSTLLPLINNSGIGAGDIVDVGVDQSACPYETGNVDALLARGVKLQTNCGNVVFADPHLESAVRAQLRKYSGPITPSDAARLTSLVATNASIHSLSGLEYCTNLAGLTLSNNQVSDLKPLARLTGITRLSLDNNFLGDLTPLAGLTKLWSLVLSNNDIERIDGLAGLHGLTRLELDGNRVSDLQPLASLTQMETLTLHDNRIENLGSLVNMRQLTSLTIDRNAVNDLTPLTGASALKDLRLSGNHVRDLSPLVGMSQLSYLDGSNNLISDLTPLTHCPMLQNIYLSNNEISTLAPLVDASGVTGGATLVLTENPLVCSSEAAGIQTLLDHGVNVETDCGPGASCAERKLVGAYALQLHSETRVCFTSDFTCSEPNRQDLSASFSLYALPDHPDLIQGLLHAPGLIAGGGDEGYFTAEIFYPGPGNPPSTWSESYSWNESLAGDWVRLRFDVCWDELFHQMGFVQIDVELATGRVLDFERRCNTGLQTLWYDDRASGTGRLVCESPG